MCYFCIFFAVVNRRRYSIHSLHQKGKKQKTPFSHPALLFYYIIFQLFSHPMLELCQQSQTIIIYKYFNTFMVVDVVVFYGRLLSSFFFWLLFCHFFYLYFFCCCHHFCCNNQDFPFILKVLFFVVFSFFSLLS